MVKHPIDALIERLKSDEVSTSELRGLLGHTSIVVRANALDALARRALQDETLVDDIGGAACDPKNTAQLMGTVAVSHVAIASLFRAGTPKAISTAQHLLEEWPEPDREDLLWFLRSEGLLNGGM